MKSLPLWSLDSNVGTTENIQVLFLYLAISARKKRQDKETQVV
jgi:hypothetical protein